MKKLQIDRAETAINGACDAETPAPTTDRSPEVRFPSMVTGRIAALLETGVPLIDFPGNDSGRLVSAQSLIPLTPADTGRNVALTFEDGDPSLPIIVGLFQTPHPATAQPEVRLDNESLILSAKKEVVIQCGKSSITLTSAGKVLIRGAYLLSRSTGVNRIKGGSVQIN